MKINLILLAAGNSRRFNGNKLLALYKGKPIYMHVVEKALNLEVNKIICVTQYEEIRKNLKNTKINVEKIPVEIKCNECGYSGVLGKNNYVCPKCKGIVYEITKGKEFYLDTMEVD